MDNLELKEEKENLLFNRKESRFEIQAKVTPSRANIGKLISEKSSVPIDNIEIKKIIGKFGSNFFEITAFIYDSKEDRMSTEKKPKLIIEQKAEEKQEKPKEEKTEDSLNQDSETESADNR